MIHTGRGLQFWFKRVSETFFHCLSTIKPGFSFQHGLQFFLPQPGLVHVGTEHQRFITIKPGSVITHIIGIPGDPAPRFVHHQPGVFRHMHRGARQADNH
ncbi:hypothetical protein D3C73_1507550 [compost metagenome]